MQVTPKNASPTAAKAPSPASPTITVSDDLKKLIAEWEPDTEYEVTLTIDADGNGMLTPGQQESGSATDEAEGETPPALSKAMMP